MLAEITDFAQGLTAAGIPASLDPAAVEAPGAWVHATSLDPITLDLAAYEIRATVYLVSRDLGTLPSLEVLERLLTTLLEHVTPSGPIETDAFVATRAGNLPAFAVPVTIIV